MICPWSWIAAGVCLYTGLGQPSRFSAIQITSYHQFFRNHGTSYWRALFLIFFIFLGKITIEP